MYLVRDHEEYFASDGCHVQNALKRTDQSVVIEDADEGIVGES